MMMTTIASRPINTKAMVNTTTNVVLTSFDPVFEAGVAGEWNSVPEKDFSA